MHRVGCSRTKPCSSITIISPGMTSRTRSKPMGPNAQSSEATHHSSPCSDVRLPSTSGLTSKKPRSCHERNPVPMEYREQGKGGRGAPRKCRCLLHHGLTTLQVQNCCKHVLQSAQQTVQQVSRAKWAYDPMVCSVAHCQRRGALPDAKRVSKGNKANTSNHANAAVSALQQLHAGCPCLKHQLHLVGGGVT